jgi:hypothetical protein
MFFCMHSDAGGSHCVVAARQWAMGRFRSQRWLNRLVGATVVVLLVTPAVTSQAGAPNYECQAGAYRIGIDQHRRAGLVRIGRGAIQPMPFNELQDQNGASLKLGVDLPGTDGVISITGYGSSMTLQIGSRTYRGECAFVPGNFVLGHVTATKAMVRTDPDDKAAVVTDAHRGSLVWSFGRFDEAANAMRGTEEWTQLRTVLTIRGGAAGGGEQAIGMGQASGLDGGSTVLNGWVRVARISLLANPQ